MIIRPNGTEELVEEIKALPAHKRKVVIFVNRHSNEGTYEIALREHKKWEDEGAVVVKLPNKWTPRGIALEASSRHMNSTELRSHMQHIPTEASLTEQLRANGVDVPTIAFHGAGLSLPVRIGAILHSESRFKHLFPDAPIENVDELCHPNMIGVEHFFKGRKPSNNKKLRSYLGRVRDEFEASDDIVFSYLRDRRATKKDIINFSLRYSRDMIGIIRRLLGREHSAGGFKGLDV